ncbi:MAG TPA: CU044_2847 family protein, partial [Pseudonocardiaceae bacterium]|nr:CU044_2847 family protein [Pseudonocardiaceae bacterium]
VGMVVRETLAGMERAELAQATAAGLRASSVELSFGVKLTVGAGKAIEAVVTAGGEASVQVVVTLDHPG